MTDKSIIFMGTPEFAVTILEHLHKDGIDIKAVITAPDKPSGRGQKINKSAVKVSAEKLNIPILQPENLKDAAFISELEKIKADLFVVVAFRMLPESVWSMPELGTINLHASLLPNYRGAAPINWAIINGEIETGVTTFFIEKEIDTGKIIQQEKVDITSDMKVDELYMQLMTIGADTMLNTVHSIFNGTAKGITQDNFDLTTIKPAPKLFKTNCQIDFNKTAKEVHDFCRGLSPYPCAWAKFKDKNDTTKTYKIISTELVDSIESDKTIYSTKTDLYIKCSDSYIKVLVLQPEGKRKMESSAFLAGNTLESIAI